MRGACVAGGSLRDYIFFCFLLRTALRDRPKGPSTANRQPPPTANRQRRPTANHRQPPSTTNPPPPTAANRHQLPPTATNRQPPTAHRQPPTANTWCACGLFWENCATEHFLPSFFFPVKDCPGVLGLCCGPTHPLDRAVHAFPSRKRYCHCTCCTVSPCSVTSLPWLPVGITVTRTRSNGDRVPATVISAPECGQCMSIE